ncbi:MAG: hypothetical protein WDN04_26445 [Rhodospirillales bacterium]
MSPPRQQTKLRHRPRLRRHWLFRPFPTRTLRIASSREQLGQWTEVASGDYLIPESQVYIAKSNNGLRLPSLLGWAISESVAKGRSQGAAGEDIKPAATKFRRGAGAVLVDAAARRWKPPRVVTVADNAPWDAKTATVGENLWSRASNRRA